MNRYCYKITSYIEGYDELGLRWSSYTDYLRYSDGRDEMLSKPRKAKCNRSLTYYIVEGGLVKRFLGVKK